MKNNASFRPDSELLDLLDPATGVERREMLLGTVLSDPRRARELRLMMALEASAQQLAADLVSAPTSRRWLRLSAPVAAAALLMLMWPQQVRHPHALNETVASTTSVAASDELLSGSFEVGHDRAFGGGFE